MFFFIIEIFLNYSLISNCCPPKTPVFRNFAIWFSKYRPPQTIIIKGKNLVVPYIPISLLVSFSLNSCIFWILFCLVLPPLLTMFSPSSKYSKSERCRPPSPQLHMILLPLWEWELAKLPLYLLLQGRKVNIFHTSSLFY